VERARHYGAIARDSLGVFPSSEVKDALVNLIDFCIERPY
jgi:octaprenyl-diphosphate synthase